MLSIVNLNFIESVFVQRKWDSGTKDQGYIIVSVLVSTLQNMYYKNYSYHFHIPFCVYYFVSSFLYIIVTKSHHKLIFKVSIRLLYIQIEKFLLCNFKTNRSDSEVGALFSISYCLLSNLQ